MISLMPLKPRDRRRIQRRDALKLAALGSLGPVLPQAALAATSQRSHPPTAKHCIYIFLCGGPSQLDMWDPKPQAPAEIRGPFEAISTSVPGVRFGELIPQVARRADKLAVVRSLQHDSTVHNTGILYTLTGTVTPPSKRSFPPTRDDFPGFGAVLQSLLGSPRTLPAWVVLPRVFTTGSRFYKGQTGGFLGPAYDPFTLDEPKRDSLGNTDIEVQALTPPDELDENRLAARRSLLANLDASAPVGEGPAMRQLQGNYEKAFSLLSSGGAKRAFDLEREPDALRQQYGMNEYGQSFLLARRLVESGVRMVNVFWTYYGEDGCQFNLWDNHGSNKDVCGGVSKGVEMLQHDYCCPSFDRAFAALLDDLDDRGLLDETLVTVIGEFGRTPKINKKAGRDHWGSCYSAVLAGGGVQGGRVYGASDAHAAYVRENPVTTDDVTATLYHAFGFAPEAVVYDPTDRPHHISRGRPLTALF